MLLHLMYPIVRFQAKKIVMIFLIKLNKLKTEGYIWLVIGNISMCFMERKNALYLEIVI